MAYGNRYKRRINDSKAALDAEMRKFCAKHNHHGRAELVACLKQRFSTIAPDYAYKLAREFCTETGAREVLK